MPRASALLALGIVAGLSLAHQAKAGLVNDVPSCYAATQIAQPSTPYDGVLYVLIDQTVKLDPTLEQSVVDNVMRSTVPGTKLVLAQFSAFSQGHYLTVEHSEILEKPLDPSRVNDTPIVAARNLDECLHQQWNFAKKMALSTLGADLTSGTDTLDQSDILQALKTIAPPIAGDKAQSKVVFLVSDGLENSSVTSFYAHNTVRQIDPQKELAKAKATDLIGDFGGARIYILGGAMMPPPTVGTKAAQDGYRNPQILNALSNYWAAYFKASNAELVEFGTPALVSPVTLLPEKP